MNVAVTGHRDLFPEDLQAIKLALAEYVKVLRNRFPHTPIRLLSGLAEGADQVAAEVALQEQCELVAVFPFPQTVYEEDFDNPRSLDAFRAMHAKAAQTIVVPAPANAGDLPRDLGYVRLGQYLAQHAQIVIAIWNGVVEQPLADGTLGILPGGTADLVRLCRTGVASEAADIISPPEVTHLAHLYARRRKPQAEPHRVPLTTGDWVEGQINAQTPTAEQIRAVLSAMDKFNEACVRMPREASNQSREWLTGKSPPAVCCAPCMSPLLTAFACADAASVKRSQQRTKAIKAISFMTALSVIAQQIYSGPDMRWEWLLAHIGLALLAFVAFLYFFRGNSPRETQYMDWRALAEGLRIQVFWHAAGVDKSVADYYQLTDRSDVNWIRHAIRNLRQCSGIDHLATDLKWVQDAWVSDQARWFEKKWPIHQRIFQRLGAVAKALLVSGMLLTLLTLAAHLGNAASETLNYLVLASGVSLLCSAIVKTYTHQMGYQEHCQRYRAMGPMFAHASQKISMALAAKDPGSAQPVVHSLGKEALSENAHWLRLHRQRQFDLDLG